MRKHIRKVIWCSAFLVYAGSATLVTVAGVKPLIFLLGVPWSLLLSMFAPLIGHVYGVSGMSIALWVAEGVNGLILLTVAARQWTRSPSEFN